MRFESQKIFLLFVYMVLPPYLWACRLKVYINLSFGPHNQLFLFTCRFHYIGLFVLFIHDFADVFLELAKSILYFKERDGKLHNLPEILANVLFAIFVLQW